MAARLKVTQVKSKVSEKQNQRDTLRSLGLMRDISPDYLNRFMVHVDTLLCLDEADKNKPVVKKPVSTPKPLKK